MIRLIGIGGHLRHGKDEVGKALAALGWVRVGFADALKEEVLAKLPLTLNELALAMDLRPQGGSAVERRLVYETKPPIIRRLLQEYGTEVRRADDPDYWCKRWVEAVRRQSAPVFATDVRFPNEADYVRMLGGTLLKVVRPSEPVDLSHASERFAAEYDGWDATIVNDGTVAELGAKVRAWLAPRTQEAA